MGHAHGPVVCVCGQTFALGGIRHDLVFRYDFRRSLKICSGPPTETIRKDDLGPSAAGKPSGRRRPPDDIEGVGAVIPSFLTCPRLPRMRHFKKTKKLRQLSQEPASLGIPTHIATGPLGFNATLDLGFHPQGTLRSIEI